MANRPLAEGVSAQPTTSMFVYQALGNRARSVSTNRYANRFEISCPARRYHRIVMNGDLEAVELRQPLRDEVKYRGLSLARSLTDLD